MNSTFLIDVSDAQSARVGFSQLSSFVSNCKSETVCRIQRFKFRRFQGHVTFYLRSVLSVYCAIESSWNETMLPQDT